MLGVLDGLRGAGVDLSEADLIVGTSAGALAGAALAGGALDRAVEIYGRSEIAPFRAPATFGDFMAAAARVAAGASDAQEAVKRTANLDPLGSSFVSDEEAANLFDALLPLAAWPLTRLVITATDAESGLRVAFDAGSDVQLLDAVRASCAVPGVFSSIPIDGARYADGGLRSPYNADLAVGHGVVIVLSPLGANPYLQRLLDAEIASLRGAAVRVIMADEASLSAIGSDLLSTLTSQAALDAGRAQAARESEMVRSIWTASERQPG